MTFGEALFNARIERGISQQAAGELIGVNNVTICQYENEKYSPSLENALKLSKALGFSLDGLEPLTVLQKEKALCG